MVTLLTPNGTKSSINYQQPTTVVAPENQASSEVLDETFGPVIRESGPAQEANTGNGDRKTRSSASLFTGIAQPLVALYDLVSGPAMSQRDRHRREIGEASTKSNASLMWFNRTPWV